MLPSRDQIHSFHLRRAGVRGQVAHLEAAWQEILDQADYPAAVTDLLGETLVASALFAGSLKFEGGLSIHLRHAGGLALLFAECSHDGNLRGIARVEEGLEIKPVDLADPALQLAITIENARTDTRYQGMVAVPSAHLGAAFEGYFEQSEQLPTRMLLAVRGGRCAGILIQRIASQGGGGFIDDEDAWDRICHLFATLSAEELLELPVEEVLLRLFHEEEVLLEEARPLRFRCTCSPERVTSMLRSLGEKELALILQEKGKVSVTCEFCNRCYAFDAIDLAGLFVAAPMAPTSGRSQ